MSDISPRTPSFSDPGGQIPDVTETSVARLMHVLEHTQEEELSCEETFALLDEYVELAVSKSEAAALMPLVKHHLDGCPDCHDYYDSLLRILQTEP